MHHMFSVFPSFFSPSFIPFHFRLCTGSLRQADLRLVSFSVHIFLTVLSALAVCCRLSKVTEGWSGRWCGDGVIVWLFAYAFVSISERLNSFYDLSPQSKVCLLGISVCCSLCRCGFQCLSGTFSFFCLTCPVFTLLIV